LPAGQARPLGGLLREPGVQARSGGAEGIRLEVTDRQEYRVEGLPEPFSHYTDAVRAGDLLFISGCVALDADGKLVAEGDVVGQARQVFENIGLCLAAAGATFADV